MQQVTLDVTLTLIGPVLTRASSGGPLGIDSVAARTQDAEQRLYLPFSLVKGRLRQAWKEMGGALSPEVGGPSIDRRLGAKSAGRGNQPSRGQLRFSDFVYAGSVGSGRLHRVRIDPERGAADEGAIQVIEGVVATGQEAEFCGQIEFAAADDAEADQIRRDVDAGLRWIPNFGAERAVGFGRLAAVAIKKSTRPLTLRNEAVEPHRDPAAVSHDLLIELNDPFCVAKPGPNRNLFESDTILPGAVLKGAVASAINALRGREPGEPIRDEGLAAPLGALARNLDRLRFTHAFPAPQASKTRPVVLPLSLVKDAGGAWWDVALLPGPALLGVPPRAPAFAVDWKEREDVRSEFGWEDPKRELRVRTAIDWGRRRAKDEQLFAYEMVVPRGFQWLARVDLDKIPLEERGAVIAQLEAVVDTAPVRIGKTKARARVAVQPAGTIVTRHPSRAGALGGRWVVALQTPALLADPRRLRESSGQADLATAYEAAWADLHGGLLTLGRFFASQSLLGGYLVHRFRRDEPYNPFLLTDAGSVFVFAPSPNADIDAAEKKVGRWLAHGLPLPGWAKERYGDDWRTCPFRPEEGFGEVAVNLPCHHERRPEVFHVI